MNVQEKQTIRKHWVTIVIPIFKIRETIDMNDIHDAFNNHFTDVSKILSQKISPTSTFPESYISHIIFIK